jgi:hypothetical protein
VGGGSEGDSGRQLRCAECGRGGGALSPGDLGHLNFIQGLIGSAIQGAKGGGAILHYTENVQMLSGLAQARSARSQAIA